MAPVSSVTEVEMLIHFGADELYCGISTPEWEDHFKGLWWMNRRNPHHANLTSWDNIKNVVNLAHDNNVEVHLTLNSPFYTPGSRNYILKLIDKMVNYLNIDALIVSDINLLQQLCYNEFPIKLHLSSLGSCFNSYTVDFYHYLGISRIILPRQLRAKEIYHIVHEKSNIMEFEVFAINDGCYFEEGFCQTTHSFGPFCLTNYDMEFRSLNSHSSFNNINKYILKDELSNYLWYQNNCGSTFQEQGLPNGPCSLCLFGHFRDWGVTSVKIAGREASFYRKCASIQLVKSIIDDVRNGLSPESISYNAKNIRNTPNYCNSGYMCYFRDPDFDLHV